jgi:outer membrane immunogenic protein
MKRLHLFGTIGSCLLACLEVALDRNWSAKLEYLHIDLGTANLPGSASGTTTLAVPVTNEIIRAGVNFRF